MNPKEIIRRIMMLAGISRITSQNDAGPVQQAQIQDPLNVRSDTLRFAEFGFSSGLPPGTDVVTLSLGGDRSSQIIVASNHNGLRFVNLKPGEVVVYNQWGQYVKLTENEIEIEANGQEVNVNHASSVNVTASTRVYLDTPTVRVTGNLEVEGDITDLCNINESTVGNLRDAYNRHDHDVRNIQGGFSTVTSERTDERV